MVEPGASPQSWTLPHLGGVAAEPLPSWLVVAMQHRYLSVNRMGGFTDELTGHSCMAGATIHRGGDGTFTFTEVQALAA